jgi:hypothetical protein
METTLKSHLYQCARVYAERRSIQIVTLARLAAGDWRFFERLNEGCSFTIRKYDSVMLWFATNWPDDLNWPEDVPRPNRFEPINDEKRQIQQVSA